MVGRLHSGTATGVDQIFSVGLLFGGPLERDAGEDPIETAARHAGAAPEFAIGVTALFLLYLAAVWLMGRVAGAGARAVVLAFAVLYQALALLSPWMLSTDVYAYLFYGRILAVYGGNPYSELPAQYAGDPFYSYIFWKYAPSFYGPLWTLFSAGIARLAGEQLAFGVTLFRGAAAAAALGAAWLVWWILRQVDRPAALRGALLVAWNPLFVVESGLSGHNDAPMVMLMALALALVVARRPALAAGALVLAALIKVVALALGPLLALYVLRRSPSWRERSVLVLRGGLVATGLTVALTAPVWAGPSTLAVGSLGGSPDRYVNSLAELALGELRVLFGETRDDTEVPLQFSGWWVATHARSPLRAARDDGATVLRELPQWSELLVVGPERRGWLRVYDPAVRSVGFVRAAALGPAARPAELDGDPDILARERGPLGSLALQAANRLIRLVGWATFGLAFIWALAAGTRSLMGLPRAWLVVLLVLLHAASTWFWPWYGLWGLIPAALASAGTLSRWMVLLSWGLLLLYAALGFGETDVWWVHTYRSIAAFGAPLLLLTLDGLLRAIAEVGRPPWQWAGARPGPGQAGRGDASPSDVPSTSS